MKIVVTGGNGQLASAFRMVSPKYGNCRFAFAGRQDMDVTSAEAVERYMNREAPDVLINCAGYTDVDGAENNVAQAQLVNSRACAILAGACSAQDVLMVHVSSDYVFDGKKSSPYTEKDAAVPGTVYGKSKLDGEIEVLFNARRSVIIRTSWLYSSVGHNFFTTIMDKVRTVSPLRVVFDQVGSPTYAPDLAEAIMAMIPELPPRIRGEIYHYSNEGVCSWYDFAKAIVDMARIRNTVVPVTSAEFPSVAARPPFSVLDKSRIKGDFGLDIPYWRVSLENCVALHKK